MFDPFFFSLFFKRETFRKLTTRNTEQKKDVSEESKIYLPFIIVHTKNENIECEVNENHSAYFFSFHQPFEIQSDTEVLKRMKLI